MPRACWRRRGLGAHKSVPSPVEGSVKKHGRTYEALAAGKILVATDAADAAVKWSKKMLVVADGHDVAMYKLP